METCSLNGLAPNKAVWRLTVWYEISLALFAVVVFHCRSSTNSVLNTTFAETHPLPLPGCFSKPDDQDAICCNANGGITYRVTDLGCGREERFADPSHAEEKTSVLRSEELRSPAFCRFRVRFPSDMRRWEFGHLGDSDH